MYKQDRTFKFLTKWKSDHHHLPILLFKAFRFFEILYARFSYSIDYEKYLVILKTTIPRKREKKS
jgi:hypothetical protein